MAARRGPERRAARRPRPRSSSGDERVGRPVSPSAVVTSAATVPVDAHQQPAVRGRVAILMRGPPRDDEGLAQRCREQDRGARPSSTRTTVVCPSKAGTALPSGPTRDRATSVADRRAPDVLDLQASGRTRRRTAAGALNSTRCALRGNDVMLRHAERTQVARAPPSSAQRRAAVWWIRPDASVSTHATRSRSVVMTGPPARRRAAARCPRSGRRPASVAVHASSIDAASQPPSRSSTCAGVGVGVERERVAADPDRLAGHAGGGVRGEPDHERRDVVGGAEGVLATDGPQGSARRARRPPRRRRRSGWSRSSRSARSGRRR